MNPARLSLSALLAAGLTLATRAGAVDVWSTPNPGIRHLHRTTPAPAEFHALVIDLDTPGVQIRCTPPRERWKSTSAYARESNLAAAINGGFWGLFGQGAEGLAAGDKVVRIDDMNGRNRKEIRFDRRAPAPKGLGGPAAIYVFPPTVATVTRVR